jgi:hypothetical protein
MSWSSLKYLGLVEKYLFKNLKPTLIVTKAKINMI